MQLIKFLVFICCAFLALHINAQEARVQLGESYELPKDQVLQGHLFSNAKAHYVWFTKQPFAGRTNRIYIERYDNNLKLVAEDEYKTASKKVTIHGLRYFKNKFIWLMSFKDKKKSKIRYQISKIRLDGSLTKARTISSFDYNKFLDEPRLEWAISEDTTKAFFASIPDNNKKSRDFRAHLTVIDENVSKLWSKTIRLPYTEKQVVPMNWAVSNNGVVYLLAKVYTENNVRESKRGEDGREPSYSYFLFIQKDRSSKLIKKQLDLDGSFVNGAGIRLDENGHLACTGFYKESYRGPIQGVFYLKFDGEDYRPLFSDMRDFTPKELDSFGRYNTSKDRRSKDIGLDNNFRFSDLEFLDDGSFIAIAEEYDEIINRYNDGRGMMRTTITYISNSIVDIHVNPDGEVTSVNIIPKRMRSGTNMFSSYSVLNNGENLYYFYNDSRANVEKGIVQPDRMRSPSGLKSYVAVMSYNDKRGKFNRKELFRSKDVGSLMMANKSHQIDENRLFFFNTRTRFMTNNTFQFGVITIE